MKNNYKGTFNQGERVDFQTKIAYDKSYIFVSFRL